MSNTNQHVRERQRLDFAKIQSAIQIPNLIEVQMKSYQRFLQMDLLPSEREDAGLRCGHPAIVRRTTCASSGLLSDRSAARKGDERDSCEVGRSVRGIGPVRLLREVAG